MTPAKVLRDEARRIRDDVAYDSKWGSNFPHVQTARLREAQELDEAANRISPKPVGPG